MERLRLADNRSWRGSGKSRDSNVVKRHIFDAQVKKRLHKRQLMQRLEGGLKASVRFLTRRSRAKIRPRRAITANGQPLTTQKQIVYTSTNHTKRVWRFLQLIGCTSWAQFPSTTAESCEKVTSFSSWHKGINNK